MLVLFLQKFTTKLNQIKVLLNVSKPKRYAGYSVYIDKFWPVYPTNNKTEAVTGKEERQKARE